MSEIQPPQRHPLYLFAILILLMIGGSAIFGMLGVMIGGLVYGFENISNPDHIGFLRILQSSLSIGTFVLPAWFFPRFSSISAPQYLKLNTRLFPVYLILTIAVVISSSAPLEWAIQLNKQLQLPDFLKTLEDWMRQKEEETLQLVKQLTTMNGPGDLMINLLMLALLPALGEEMIFRGSIQPLFTRLFNNYHWGIWISAIIFSAIHLQFYGFLPRMLLGGMFGYLLVWSNSLWIPILAHFMNNAGIIVLAYSYQQQGLSTDALEGAPQGPMYLYFINLFLTFVGLMIFYQYAKAKNTIPYTN
jgi:membrane protease YdiL (CAAX protease family)